MKDPFDRAPPASLLRHLSPGGWLAPLLHPRQVHTRSGPLPTHVQFRPNAEVMVYCGSARLLVASVSGTAVTFSADAYYEEQDAGRALFGKWRVGLPGLSASLDAWFEGVQPKKTQVKGEGRVQALWHALDAPWLTIDHEAALAYDDTGARVAALCFPGVDAAAAAVRAHGRASAQDWSTVLPAPGSRNSRDQLAVDSEGNLVVIELKQSGAPSPKLYYAPLQLLRYLYEDARQLDVLIPSIQALVDARVALGLLPPNVPRLTGRVRPVVAWGDGTPSANTVRHTVAVLDLVQPHLPPEAAPMELWHLPNGRPARLA